MVSIDIVIKYDKMNSTQSMESNQEPVKNNSELYLLIIIIKLSILLISKIGQALVCLYKMHNRKVIEQHNSTTIAKLRELTSKIGDSESVFPTIIK